MKTTLEIKQANKQAQLNKEFELLNKLFEVCGHEAKIIGLPRNEFAVFYPKTREDYLKIINSFAPTINAKVEFAGKNSIETFSPYLVTYGGEHSTPNYMKTTVKFKHELLPIWVEMDNETAQAKFIVNSFDGAHKGFGKYERKYTHTANGGTKVQEYSGKYKTMYASTEQEAIELKKFITN
jgi:hypothetical protein